MKLSRRQFIGLGFGGAAAATVCTVSGIGAGLYLARQLKDESQSVAEVIPLATSPANRTNLTQVIERPVIVSRTEWGALAPNYEAENENGFFSDENPEGWRVYEPDIRDIYKTLVMHHSVIDEGDDISTLLEIQALHRGDRQWADVAYHYFIGKEGTVYEGRDINVRGTHVAGYNTGSLGVCLLGDFTISLPTDAQITTANALGLWLAVRLQLTHIAGHRDFNDFTVCPGDFLVTRLAELAEATGLIFGTDGYVAPPALHDGENTDGVSQHQLCGCHA
jgi:hypothetical protein